jgi:hypothetical protein
VVLAKAAANSSTTATPAMPRAMAEAALQTHLFLPSPRRHSLPTTPQKVVVKISPFCSLPSMHA